MVCNSDYCIGNDFRPMLTVDRVQAISKLFSQVQKIHLYVDWANNNVLLHLIRALASVDSITELSVHSLPKPRGQTGDECLLSPTTDARRDYLANNKTLRTLYLEQTESDALSNLKPWGSPFHAGLSCNNTVQSAALHWDRTTFSLMSNR